MKKPLFYLLLIVFLSATQYGCKKDNANDDNNDNNGQKTLITFTIDGETYKLADGNAVVTDSYIQVVATRTESGEEYTFQAHLPGGEGVCQTDEMNFTCGKDVAFCANETYKDFGADLVIEITQVNPGLKGTFSGKVVQCMTANPPVKKIENGQINIDEKDIVRM